MGGKIEPWCYNRDIEVCEEKDLDYGKKWREENPDYWKKWREAKLKKENEVFSEMLELKLKKLEEDLKKNEIKREKNGKELLEEKMELDYKIKCIKGLI